MNLKNCFLLIPALVIAGTASAQDKIYKRNGDVIDGKVKEVTTKEIIYKKSDNPDGPSYRISKSAVDKVEYKNGSADEFGDEEASTDDERMDRRERMRRPHPEMRERKNAHYGNNILAISPLQITEKGIGVGLSYEAVLDKRGILSFYLPAMISFDNFDNGNGTSNYGRPFYYFMPGLKFYPTGSKGVVRYAVGPNLVLRYGQEYIDQYYYSSTYPYTSYHYAYGYEDRFSLGVQITNSLNINPTDHLHLGLEMGIGLTYLNQLNGYNDNINGFFNLGFKVGYRF